MVRGRMASILEVCDYHGPYPGNFIPTVLATGARVQDELGLDYRLIFPDDVQDRPWTQLVRDAGFEALYVPRTLKGRAGVGFVRAQAEAQDAAVIRTHFTYWDLEALAAGRLTRTPVIWNVHTGNLDYGPKRRAADLVKARSLGRLVHRVVGVSEEIGRDLRRRGFPAGRIEVIPNGIDLARFDDLPDRRAARAALGVEPRHKVVLAFGWTPHRKGVDVIADAVAAAADPDLLAVVVGGDETRAFLAPGRAGVRVVDPVDDPRALFAAADVFVSASREEAFSYSIGEAMACGVPVVSSDIPGPAAYFAAAGVHTFPSEDAGALAAVLDDVLRHHPRSAGVLEDNRRFLRRDLSLDRHVDRVLALFREALAA